MRRVVVGASDRAEDRALDFALTEAIRRRLPLLVVGAYRAPSYGDLPSALLPGRIREVREACTRETAAALGRAQDRVSAAGTVAVTTGVREGDTASCLLAAAESAALLVIGSRPDGLLARTLHGSVATACLHRARCPVVLVPHGSEVITDRWLRSRILVGLNGSPASLTALTWAVAQAREWGCVLGPVVVSSGDGHLPIGFGGSQDLTGQVRQQVEAAGGSDLEIHPHFLVGEHKQQLVQLAEATDLLVVGSSHRGALTTKLADATSTPVALRSCCPVVVVREGQARREIHQRRVQPSQI
jgi:nucleotide-binding universal stress UspA family protein